MFSPPPSPPTPTFALQYLLYVNRSASDGAVGLGNASGETLECSTARANTSSQTPFSTARCLRGAVPRKPHKQWSAEVRGWADVAFSTERAISS